jgi:hypothetical protein
VSGDRGQIGSVAENTPSGRLAGAEYVTVLVRSPGGIAGKIAIVQGPDEGINGQWPNSFFEDVARTADFQSIFTRNEGPNRSQALPTDETQAADCVLCAMNEGNFQVEQLQANSSRPLIYLSQEVRRRLCH